MVRGVVVWGAVVALLAGSAAAADVVRFGPVVVAPHAEREVCEYRVLRFRRPGDLFVGYRYRVRGTSHHFIVRDASTALGHVDGLRDGGSATCAEGGLPAYLNGVAQRGAFRFPPDVGLPWSDAQPVVLNLHIVNGTSRPMRGSAVVHLERRRRRPADRVASYWQLYVGGFDVPPFTRATVGKSQTFATPVELLLLATHMHVRGTRFTVTRDGAPWLEADDWRRPVVQPFVPPLAVPTGTRIDIACDYDNGVTQPVHLCDGAPCALPEGPLADDAMCTIVGFVIPP